jgi:hypothetical protein
MITLHRINLTLVLLMLLLKFRVTISRYRPTMFDLVLIDSYKLYLSKEKSKTDEAMNMARSFVWNLNCIRPENEDEYEKVIHMCDCSELLKYYISSTSIELATQVRNFLGKTIDRKMVCTLNVNHKICIHDVLMLNDNTRYSSWNMVKQPTQVLDKEFSECFYKDHIERMMNISCRIATENWEGRLISTNIIDEVVLPPFLFVIDSTNLYDRGDIHQNVINLYMPFKIDISNSTSYVVFATSSDLNYIRKLVFLDIRLCLTQ